MADLTLTCSVCKKTMTASEYVSGTVKCASCGKDIPIPMQKHSSGLTLKKDPPPEEKSAAAAPSASAAPLIDPHKASYIKEDQRKVRMATLLKSLSWAVFLLLGMALYYIRYHNGLQIVGLPNIPLADLKQYGLIAIGVAYLICVIMAVKDGMFTGLLAIIVPLYPFYHLFLVSSAVFLRAIVAALLLGFGLDFLLFLQTMGSEWGSKIHYWIGNV